MAVRVTRLKVLISAYACEPGKGSEPGVGWSVAREMARYHDVWVLTRANNRKPIEDELLRHPIGGLQFAYYDLPNWIRWWKSGPRGVQFYYYLWQFGASRMALNLHEQLAFDLTHHVTFGRYWTPALVSRVDAPFVWGPVGGGDDTPLSFLSNGSVSQKLYERWRAVAKWLGERDPLLQATARLSNIALAATGQTQRRLSSLKCRRVYLEPQVAMGQREYEQLAAITHNSGPITRFISIGRPLHWKGFELGLRAFAASAIPDSEYWLIANGPGRKALERLVTALGINRQVHFVDSQSTLEDVYAILGACDVLVHPALHETFGTVVLEAMAAAKPVLCLDLGGPAVQVTPETGFKVAAHEPEQAVRDLAAAMVKLTESPELRRLMGEEGRKRARTEFSWERKGEVLNEYYLEAVGGQR